MVIELSQVLKILDVVKSHQKNGTSKQKEVRKDFELRKIDKGLEYPNYADNENFCLETKIILKENDDLMLITDHGTLVRTSIKDIRQLGRNTQGVKLQKLGKNEKLSQIEKVEEDKVEEI